MSFDLAFWVGARLASDADAAAELERLYDLHLGDQASDPHPSLLAFISDVTSRYPDLTELGDDEIDDAVWSDGPLTSNASGPLLYLGIVWSRVDEALPFLVERARAHGLICLDPQSEQVRT